MVQVSENWSSRGAVEAYITSFPPLFFKEQPTYKLCQVEIYLGAQPVFLIMYICMAYNVVHHAVLFSNVGMNWPWRETAADCMSTAIGLAC